MKSKAWEKLAHKYNRQWVQKYSLGPTRREVLKIVLPLLGEDANRKILDIGCGTGQLVQEILLQYPKADYLGIDAAENMIHIARESNSAPTVNFLRCPVEDFQTETKYDIIICTHAFPYFPNQSEVMKKISSMCSENAAVVICNSSTNNIKDFFINLYLKIFVGKANYLSVKKMLALFAYAGLEIQNINYIKERRYMPTIALFHVKKQSVS